MRWLNFKMMNPLDELLEIFLAACVILMLVGIWTTCKSKKL